MVNKMELEVVNPHCAGIDVGSRSHFVAIGQDLSDVREFGVYADDLTAICLWLKENKITSVAMESTGPYWQNSHLIYQVRTTREIHRYSKDPKLIDSIYLENRIFVPVENAFYEILSAGPVTFFLQNRSNLTPKGNDVGYGVKSRSVGPTQHRRLELSEIMYDFGEVAYIDLPQNIEITPASLFWVSKNDKLEKFSTERQFLKIFPEYEPELKEYIKNKNINIKP